MIARLTSLAVIVAAVLAALVFAAASGGGDGGTYLVRAVFNNANFITAGEDVEVAGVKVGTIDSLDLTPQRQAVVVLRIDDPAFRPFRADAHCQIRPQSLIGEQFVECEPTQPRAAGTPLPPPLPRVTSGRGEGQYLLDVHHTTTPVAIDLVQDTLRLPYRERLTLIVNDLGAGLAANGPALNDAIRRADPALQQADRVLAIVAAQNRTLAGLVRDSDTVLAPLAQERKRVSGFIEHAGTTASATASEGAALEASLRLLPPFLRQLKPTADQLGATADQLTPALADLHSEAPTISRVVEGLGPFATAATPALETLGDAADVGRRALTRSEPLIRDLSTLGRELGPLSTNLAGLLTSFRDAGGVERLLDTIFYQASTTNGYDALGHYLRAGLIVNTCSSYSAEPAPGCSAKFEPGATAAAANYLLGPRGGR